MKRSILIFTVLILILLLSLSSAIANGIEEPGRFGLGLAIGYPGLGISTNTFVANWMSVKAELYPFYGFHDGVIDADYLFWLQDIAQSHALDFTWFAGPGFALVYWGGNDRNDDSDDNGRDGTMFVIKGAVGLALQFNAQPFDLALEISPGFRVNDSDDSLWITAMLASRYYF